MKTILFLMAFIHLPVAAYADEHEHEHNHSGDRRSHKAHVHGAGQVNFAIDGGNFLVELLVPADDIVGFEHKPKSPMQAKKLKEASAALKIAKENIDTNSEAQCSPQGPVELSSALLQTSKPLSKVKKKKASGHADFRVVYKYVCKKPSLLSSFTVLSFKKFSKMHSLSGQGITASDQYAVKLTPKAPTFRFKNK